MKQLKTSLKCVLALLLTVGITNMTWATGTTNTTTSTPTHSSATVKPIDDSAITAKVNSVIQTNKDLKNLSISVTSDQGVVTLSGTVTTDKQKQKAIKLTKKIKGVKSVNDQLTVTPSTTSTSSK